MASEIDKTAKPDSGLPTHSLFQRIRRDYARLGRSQRLCGLAALTLIVSLTLPWFGGSLVFGEGPQALRLMREESALEAFSLVELALLVTAGCVLALLFIRAERRGLGLLVSDGAFFAGAGGWALFLILFRMLERPKIEVGPASVELGLSWGVFVALVAAVGLAAVGLQMRKSERAHHQSIIHP